MKNLRSKSRSSRKLFLYSFGITLAVAVLVTGMVVADFRCRSTAIGDTVPPFQVTRAADGSTTLFVHTMGLDTSLDVSAGAQIVDFFRAFFCLPAPEIQDTPVK